MCESFFPAFGFDEKLRFTESRKKIFKVFRGFSHSYRDFRLESDKEWFLKPNPNSFRNSKQFLKKI